MGFQSSILRLAVAVVGFLGLAALTSTLLRGERTTADVVQTHRAKSNVFAMVQNLELDFRNMGSGAAPGSTFPSTPLDTLSCNTIANVPCHFRFYARVDSSSPRPSLIEYRWQIADTVAVDADGPNVELYEVTRLVDEQLRTAMDRVTSFRLAFHDRNGLRTNTLNTARRVDVDLQALVPTTSGSNHSEEVAWRQTFTPANLTRE